MDALTISLQRLDRLIDGWMDGFIYPQGEIRLLQQSSYLITYIQNTYNTGSIA